MLFNVLREELDVDSFVFLGRPKKKGPLIRCHNGFDDLQLFAVFQMCADEVRDANRFAHLMAGDKNKSAGSDEGQSPKEPKEDRLSDHDAVVGESPASPIPLE